MMEFLSAVVGILIGGILAAGMGVLVRRKAMSGSILPAPAPIPEERYVERDTPYLGPLDMIRDLDGVAWSDAPPPPPWHRCWVQTDAWLGMRHVQRCGCGAIRMAPDPVWSEKNQTAKSRIRTRG